MSTQKPKIGFLAMFKHAYEFQKHSWPIEEFQLCLFCPFLYFQ